MISYKLLIKILQYFNKKSSNPMSNRKRILNRTINKKLPNPDKNLKKKLENYY